MADRFSFYDIVAHIIPGGVGLAIIGWFYAIYTGQPNLPADVGSSIGSSILFLIASYLLGTFAQAIGEAIEEPLLHLLWGGKKPEKNPMWSLLCLQEPGFQFTKEFQKKLRGSIKVVFDLDLCCETKAETVIKAHALCLDLCCETKAETAIKAHALCYSLILQANAAQRAEKCKAIFRLFRGISVILLLAAPFGYIVVILSILSVILSILYAVGMNQFPQLQFPNHTIWLIVGISLFVAGLTLTLNAFSYFSKLFPVTVYEDFYAWYRQKKFIPSSNSAPKAEAPQAEREGQVCCAPPNKYLL